MNTLTLANGDMVWGNRIIAKLPELEIFINIAEHLTDIYEDTPEDDIRDVEVRLNEIIQEHGDDLIAHLGMHLQENHGIELRQYEPIEKY